MLCFMQNRNEYRREWAKASRDKDRDKYNAYQREWRTLNKEQNKQNRKDWGERNRLQTLVYSTRQTARAKQIEHSISVNDVEQPEFCPLTGIKIDWTYSGRHMANPSIDRIDPDVGYIPGNVEVMSCLGNVMKSKATREQLIFFAKEILKRYENPSA